MIRPFRVNVAKDWEYYGKHSPYFGVHSNHQYLGKIDLDAVEKERFFKSGDLHIDNCLKILAEIFGYIPKGRAMDFGCGVGRITNSLSKYFSEVIGYDISSSMIKIAQENSINMGNKNIKYVCTADGFSAPETQFDLIHSYIVLQHVPIREGMILIDSMLDSLREGGVGALHLTFSHAEGLIKGKLKQTVKSSYIIRTIYNISKFTSPEAPLMQMNNYNLSDVFNLFNKHGIDRFFCERINDWGNSGLFVFFKKDSRSKSIWSNPKR